MQCIDFCKLYMKKFRIQLETRESKNVNLRLETESNDPCFSHILQKITVDLSTLTFCWHYAPNLCIFTNQLDVY